MEKNLFFTVTVNSETLDVITANTLFYEFVGTRLYFAFDLLMKPEHRPYFDEVIEENTSRVIDYIKEDGTPLSCLTKIEKTDAEGNYVLSLKELNSLTYLCAQQKSDIDIKDTILSLYNDYFFFYTKANDNIIIFAQEKKRQIVFSGTIDEFRDKIIAASLRNTNECYKLIVSITSGDSDFSYSFEENIASDISAAYSYLCGTSYYEAAEHMYTAGYIRISNEVNTNVKKPIQRDYLTGLLSKAEITNLAIELIDVKHQPDITLCIIDIDFFKNVNDIHGHAVGDEVLKEVASIIEHEVGEGGACGRIGGDEFMVIFYNAPDMETMRERLRSVKNTVSATFCKGNRFGLSVTLSMGCAAYPKDADSYENLFLLADFALYRAKEKGRNRYVIYDIDKHGSPSAIKDSKVARTRINARGNMTPAEIYVAIANQNYFGEKQSIDKLIDAMVENMGIQRVILYAGEPHACACMSGSRAIPADIMAATIDYLDLLDEIDAYDESGILVIENVKRFEMKNQDLYAKLRIQSILSFVHIKFKDKGGNPCILSIEAVTRRISWNSSFIPCYRLMAKLMSEYRIVKKSAKESK